MDKIHPLGEMFLFSTACSFSFVSLLRARRGGGAVTLTNSTRVFDGKIEFNRERFVWKRRSLSSFIF